MHFRFLLFSISLISSHYVVAAETCEPLDNAWILLTSGSFELSARSQPKEINTSKPFDLIVNICHNKQAYIGSLKFDAQMPMHKHGMNYQASITNQNNGQYLIQGSLLHMPGLWRFSFTLDSLKQPIFYHYALP